jgi:hypothetical protein
MPVALVTGTPRHIGAAAATLGRTGFEVFTWAVGSPAAPAEGPFDCYVQLPCAGPDPAGGPESAPVRPGRSADDLVCRIDTLAAVADRLRADASILLAVDEPDGSAVSQPGGLAADLLAAVAGALLADLGRPPGRLAVIGVADLCRREAAPVGASGPGRQWEMPTPPLVSAP